MLFKYLARKMLFPRHLVKVESHILRPPADLERLYLSTEHGSVEAWFLPATGQPAKAAPLVVFGHGNAELIDFWPQMLAPYRRFGCNLLLPEYRGYGRSAGRPTQKQLVGDCVRFVDMALARSDVDSTRVVFHGRSLGGGVMSALTKYRTPDALILESTFTSVPAVAKRFGVPRFMIPDRFDSRTQIATLDLPILIIHGLQDDLIPVSHAKELHQAARHSKLLLYDGDHNTVPLDPKVYWADINIFLQKTKILQ